MNQESSGQDIHSITREIAEWCENQATKFSESASHQFRLIIAIVVGGLGLLLILPPLIGQIDNMTTNVFGGAPPSEVVKEAESAVARLTKQVEQSRNRVSKLNTELTTVRSRLDKHARDQVRLVLRAKKLFSKPLPRWEILDAAKERDIRLHAMTIDSRGRIIASGTERVFRESRIAIMRSINQRSWRVIHPRSSDNRSISGDLRAVATRSDGVSIAAGHEGSSRTRKLLILWSRFGNRWMPIRPVSAAGKRIAGTLYALARSSDGEYWAAGTEKLSRLERKLVLLHSKTGRKWRVVELTDTAGMPLQGIIWALARGPGKTLVAAGFEGNLTQRRLLIVSMQDGKPLSIWRPKDSDDVRIPGELTSLAVARNGTIIAGGYEREQGRSRPIIAQSKNAGNWQIVRHKRPLNANGRPGSNRIMAVAATQSGHLAAMVGSNLGLHKLVKKNWIPISLEHPTGRPLKPVVDTLIVGSDGSILVAGSNARILKYNANKLPPMRWKDWSIQASWKDNPKAIDAAFAGLNRLLTGKNVVFARGTAKLRLSTEKTKTEWIRDRESEPRVADLLEGAKSALREQQSTLKQVEKATKQLSTALIDADELRRASRIATRVAVVALLIYLVQIVVNRYRYLQRISGFYRARAQAFRFLAASPNLGDELLKNVTVTDLMAGLSPDAIGFDKSAEPPTQNLVNFIREAIRRERPG